MSISCDFLACIVDTLPDHIAVIDHQGKIIYVNQSWIRFGRDNGYTTTIDWLGTNYIEACNLSAARGDSFAREASEGIGSVLNKERAWFDFEYDCDSPNERRWFLMRAIPFEVDGAWFVVISHSNITERKLAEESIMQLSRVDSLTGLANRRYFDEWFTKEWHRCIREQTPITLAIIDIDHFKLLNDSRGHRAGDDCLQAISNLLLSFTKRPNDISARYGGDEFLMVYGNASLDESLVQILKLMDIIRKLEIANPIAPKGPTVTVSVGLATSYPEMESNPQDLIRAADRLLYAAKEAGRDHVEFASLNGESLRYL